MNAILGYLCAAVNLLVSTACVGTPQDRFFAAFEHPYWDAHLYPIENIDRFFWVDDETIAFEAYTGPKPRDFAEASQRTSAIYVWRLGEAPRIYVKHRGGLICAANGWISYALQAFTPERGVHVTAVIEGPLGSEKEMRFPSAKPTAGPGVAGDWLTIDPAEECAPPAVDPAMAGHEWVTNSGRHFGLDFGPLVYEADRYGPTKPADIDKRQPPIALIQLGGNNRIDLPILNTQAVSFCTHYHRFDEAFLIWDCQGIGLYRDTPRLWREHNDCWPVWRLFPADKRIDDMCLPHGDWAGNGVELVPTKVGLDFVSQKPGSGAMDPGPAGLYELRGGRVRRILPGFITNATVSPSGCKVIFGYVADQSAARYGTPGSPTIIAADLCSDRRP